VENFHEARYLNLLKSVKEGKVFKKDSSVKWHCRNCGYVFEGKVSRINAQSANIPKLTSKFWRRIIDYPWLPREVLQKDLPSLWNFLILFSPVSFSFFPFPFSHPVASSSSSWSSSWRTLLPLCSTPSSFQTFSQISPYPLFFSPFLLSFYKSFWLYRRKRDWKGYTFNLIFWGLEDSLLKIEAASKIEMYLHFSFLICFTYKSCRPMKITIPPMSRTNMFSASHKTTDRFDENWYRISRL